MADSTKTQDQKARVYHPYQDLNMNIPMNKLYYLPTSPEALFIEEASKSHRNWSENLQYYTGSAYLAGSFFGATKGTIQGLRAAEPGDSLKLRVNRVLNSGGQVGRRFGNSLGVVGLIFAGLESLAIGLRGGNDDLLNSVAAGLGTGSIYRAAAGPRSAAIAGALGGIMAAAAVGGKHMVKRYVPI